MRIYEFFGTTTKGTTHSGLVFAKDKQQLTEILRQRFNGIAFESLRAVLLKENNKEEGK